jgi:hypothetical protein
MAFNKLVLFAVLSVFSQLSFSAACPTSDTATATGANDGDDCTVTDSGTNTVIQLNFVSGFDSSTSVTATDGNNGTTVGAQRKLSFIKAAELISARIDSDVTIIVDATFSALTCTANSAVLGSAGASANVDAGGSPPSGIQANMYYPIGLYNAITGSDVSGAHNDIAASFNSDIGDADCLSTSDWYYGFSDASGNEIGFTTVLIHELTHGLGFASLVDPSDGSQSNSTDDIFSESLYDNVTGRNWNDDSQTDQNREDSAISVDDLLWNGTNVNTNAIGLLTDGFNDVDTDGNFESGDKVEMYAPATVESGSSVSHFTTDATPNEIMEPSYTDSLYELGLALYLLEDIGWTIVEPNNAPTITAVDQTTTEDNAKVVDISSWGNDADGDGLTYSVTSCAANITCSLSGTDLTLTPDANHNGATHSITIKVDDGTDNSSDTFNFNVDAQNDAPTWSTISEQNTNEDNDLIIDLTGYATDVDGDGLTFSVTSCASNITCSVSGDNLTLSPTANYSGATHNITVEADDSTASAVSTSFNLVVNAQNDAPTWSAIPNQSIDEGDNVVIDLDTYAADIDGVGLDYTDTSCGANLTCSINNNALTVTANAGGGSTVSVTIEADDNNGGTNSDTFDVDITTPANNPPTITAVNQTTTEDNAIVVDISSWGNDADNDALTYSVTSCASNITCSLSGTNLTLTPDTDHNGATHNITIKVDDGTDNSSDSFNFNIDAQNDVPVWNAIPDQNIVDGESIVIDLDTYASDIDGDALTYTATSCGTNLSCGINNNSLTVTANGGGGSTVSVSIEADDNNGGNVSDIFNVSISASNNNAPTLTTVDQTTNEDTALTIDISTWGDDADNDSLSYAIANCSDNISCALTGTNLTLTPDANHHGSSHSINLQVTDSQGASSSDIFNLNVVSVNDAPTFHDISDINLVEEHSHTLDLLDITQDIDGDAISFSLLSCPTVLDCTLTDSSLSLLANSGDGSSVQVSVQALDANGASTSQTLNVNITAFTASTYIEIASNRYDHGETVDVSVSDVAINVLGGSGNYQYQLNYLGEDASDLLSVADTELVFTLPEAGAFSGTYTLNITDTSNSETITLSLVRPLRILWSAVSLLSEDTSQEITIEGGEAGSQYSLSQQETLLTFLDSDGLSQTQFIASDNAASFNKATAQIQVSTIISLTEVEVTVTTLNNTYGDEVFEIEIYPVIEHHITVLDSDENPISGAVGVIEEQTLLNEFNLPLQYTTNDTGEMTIRLPDTQASSQMTIQSEQYNPVNLLLEPSITGHQVILTIMSQMITITGSISALGTQNFVSQPPVVKITFEDGSIDNVVVSVSNSSQASFNHNVDINTRLLSSMSIEQADSLNIELDISGLAQNQTYNILLERSIAVVTSAPSDDSGSGPLNLFILIGILAIMFPPQKRRQ